MDIVSFHIEAAAYERLLVIAFGGRFYISIL